MSCARVLCAIQVLVLWVIPLHLNTAAMSVRTELANNTQLEEIYFRSPVVIEDYRSTLDFDPRGMEHLYEITNYFLQVVQKPGLPEGVIKEEIFEAPLTVLNQNRGKLMSHFLGMMLVAVIGLVLAVVVPVAGLMFCCCRCTGHCGSAGNVMERRHDPCRQAALGTCMSILVLILMFGVVCTFVTNEYMDQGLHSLPDTVTQSMDDVQLYLENTKIEVKVLLKNNFKQLQEKLEESLGRSGYTVKTRLGEVSRAVAVDNLTEIVSNLKQIRDDLNNLVRNTRELDEATNQLQFGLGSVRRDFSDVLEKCSASVCLELKRKYDMAILVVNANLQQLPNVAPLLHNVSALLDADIEKEVKKGKNAFDELSEKIQDAVNSTIPDIKKQIAAVGNELSDTADDIARALELPKLKEAKAWIRDKEPYLVEYSKYRWYVGIGFACGMMVITICFICGLACGFCGKRPGSVYGDSSCNKGSGANLLLMGVVLIFLFFFQLLITTTAMFLVGGVAERVGCNWMENTSDPQVRELITIAQRRYDAHVVRGVQPDFSDMIRRCHENETLYHVLQLHKPSNFDMGNNRVIQKVNVSAILEYKERYSVDKKLNEFLKHLNVNPGVTILTPEGQQLLEKLKEMPISAVNFTSYASLVQQHITPVNLLDMARELYRYADDLSTTDLKHASQLRHIALQLESFQTKLIIPMTRTVENLKASAKKLEKDSRYSSKDLREALTELIDQARTAQNFIHTKGREELKKVAKEFVDEFTSLLDRYAYHVIDQVEGEIGKCGPVSKAVNATVLAVCKEIVLPFNGFWVSIGWCLIAYIPCLLFSILLSVLYRRIDPYPGPLVDIAHRKHGRSDDELFDNRNGYLPEYSPSYRDQMNPSPVNYLLANGRYPPRSRNSRTKGVSPAPIAAAGDTPDWRAQRGVTEWTALPEYSRPPPYYHPGS